MDDSAIKSDETIDEEQIVANRNEKNLTYKTKNFYILLAFINYYCIIDSCQYLLLPDTK